MPEVRDVAAYQGGAELSLRGESTSARIFLKDVRAEYSRAVFGLFWDFVDPLVYGLIFYFLKQSDVISGGETDIPYSAPRRPVPTPDPAL